jgi:hypothetical protein
MGNKDVKEVLIKDDKEGGKEADKGGDKHVKEELIETSKKR